jgi:hypothetical protein
MDEGREASHMSLDILDVPDLAYFAMAEILLGFASIPRLVMMYPRSLPRETQKVHFSGFSLMLKCLRLAKVSSRSVMRLLLYRVFMMMSST